MYLHHFGLKAEPFAITPDPHYLYLSPRHREALAHLLYGVESGGFVQLTGEVGTGKTTVCRAFLEQLPSHVDTALILNPPVTAPELLDAICRELGVGSAAEGESAARVVDRLNGKLLAAHGRGRRTLLIIDEAQNLSAEVLEQVRLLTNLETDTHKLLQIFLIGQPELRDLLGRPELRQLAQRITARYHLQPLDARETAHYIAHRLTVAGGASMLFTSGAIRRIHRAAGGIPRLINIYCDRALLGAYAVGASRVGGAVARAAAREVAGEGLPGQARRAAPLVAMLAAVVAAIVLVGERLPDLQGLLMPEPAPALRVRGGSAELPFLSQLERHPATREQAESRLLGLWDVPQEIAGDLCDQAAESGLRCATGRGTWNNLRRIGHPAIVRLSDGRADHHLLLTGFADGEAEFQLGERTVRTALLEVDRLWLGEYLLLWKPPFRVGLISPGDEGAAVEWVRAALRRAGETQISGSGPFDAALADAVRRFQRRHGLEADGLVGERTLLHLAASGGQPPSGPRLRQEGEAY